MRAVIVEDEEPSRQRLRELLSELGIEIVGEAADGKEALEVIERSLPDVVFLDINLPELSGIEVLERLSFRPKVIFVTAYDQYAVRAFEENAVDYILKPFSKERLAKAIEKAKSPDEKLLEILRKVSQKYMRKFPAKLGGEIFIIPEEEVFYFKAEEKYVFLYTDEKEYFLDFTLRELEEKLDPEKFCRVHRSYIVALDKVERISRWFKGTYVLVLKDRRRTKIKIGRNYYPELKRRLNL